MAALKPGLYSQKLRQVYFSMDISLIAAGFATISLVCLDKKIAKQKALSFTNFTP